MTNVSKIGSADLAHILAKTREAADRGSPGPRLREKHSWPRSF